jgi:hypothetical protein
MIPSQSGSMISTLSVLLPLVGIGAYLLAMPKIRKALREHLEKTHSYFFHESERTPAAPVQEAATAPVKTAATPLGQIEPAGWDYRIYEIADQDPDDPAARP